MTYRASCTHRSLLLALLAGLAIAWGPARLVVAQEVVEDTLDWRGYYPLQVGNHWEYEIKHGLLNQFSSFERRVITGDTLLDGTRYFIHEVQRYEMLDEPDSTLELRWAATDYVRYDTMRAVLYAIPADSARLHDSTDQTWPGSPFIYDYVLEPRTCNVSADFEEHFACESSEAGFISVVVDGGYLNRSYGPIRVRAQKEFGVMGVGLEITFEHGLGERIGGRILYARVDGQEYGDSTVTRLDVDSASGRAPELGGLSVYPHPVRGTLTFRLTLTVPGGVTVEVFDVLGRRVRREVLPVLPSGAHTHRLAVSALPSGAYLLRLRRGMVQVTKPFVVVE